MTINWIKGNGKERLGKAHTRKKKLHRGQNGPQMEKQPKTGKKKIGLKCICSYMASNFHGFYQARAPKDRF